MKTQKCLVITNICLKLCLASKTKIFTKNAIISIRFFVWSVTHELLEIRYRMKANVNSKMFCICSQREAKSMNVFGKHPTGSMPLRITRSLPCDYDE